MKSNYGSKWFNILIAALVMASLVGFSPATQRAAYGQSSPASVTVSCKTTVPAGEMKTNSTWTAVNSPYCLTASVWINQDVTLTIQSGVTVYASTGVYLQVLGYLNTSGTSGSPVLFTSDLDSGAGQWVGLVYDGYYGEGSGTLDYVTLRYGGQPYGGF